MLFLRKHKKYVILKLLALDVHQLKMKKFNHNFYAKKVFSNDNVPKNFSARFHGNGVFTHLLCLSDFLYCCVSECVRNPFISVS